MQCFCDRFQIVSHLCQLHACPAPTHSHGCPEPCRRGRYLRALRERLPGGLSVEDAPTIAFRFLLGRSANASEEAALDAEAATHGDILRVSGIWESYDNLFAKACP